MERDPEGTRTPTRGLESSRTTVGTQYIRERTSRRSSAASSRRRWTHVGKDRAVLPASRRGAKDRDDPGTSTIKCGSPCGYLLNPSSLVTEARRLDGTMCVEYCLNGVRLHSAIGYIAPHEGSSCPCSSKVAQRSGRSGTGNRGRRTSRGAALATRRSQQGARMNTLIPGRRHQGSWLP